MRPYNILAQPALDRAAHYRRNDSWLQRALESEESRVTIVSRSLSLAIHPADGGPPEAAKLQAASHRGLLESASSVVFLGVDRSGVPTFAAEVDLEPDALPDGLTNCELVELRSVASVLPERDANLLTYARAIMTWHERHRFCGSCGAPTEVRQAGHVRYCAQCEIEHFPRTDPAVIMLVCDDERCLLGRQASWPRGMYSTLAGFVEPGESIEAAVAREVLEETGIRVGDVEYHSSQPWPFPTSLMLGFHAHAESHEIVLDGDELEHALWVGRNELPTLIAHRELRIPPRMSIARRLIDDWLSEGPVG